MYHVCFILFCFVLFYIYLIDHDKILRFERVNVEYMSSKKK